MNNVSENLQSMFAKMENFISTETVVGQAVHFGDIILIPLVEVTMGMGSGLGGGNQKSNGDKTSDSGGGAFGARLTPAAVVVIANGTVQLVDVKNKESVNKLIDMLPGILSKFNLDSLFSKKSEGDEEDSEDPAEKVI